MQKLFIIIVSIIILVGLFLSGLILGYKIGKEDTACPYYVYHKNEKICVPTAELKEYIENIEAGLVNRLKSQRGIFPQQ